MVECESGESSGCREQPCISASTTPPPPDEPGSAVEPFPRLPNELKLLVFSYVTQQDRLKVARVCRAWRDFAYEPTLWEEAIIYNGGGLLLPSSLERLRQVRYLKGRSWNPSDEDVRRLLNTLVGSSLRVLDLSMSPSITSQALYHIGSYCSDLEKLYLGGCTEITDLEPLNGLAGTLSTLVLSYCPQLTNGALSDLVAFQRQKLRALDLVGCCDIGDAGIVRIAHTLTQLEYFAVDGQGITDTAVVTAVERCRNLRLFSVTYGEGLTDKTLLALAQNICPHLTHLRLRRGEQFTEQGLSQFLESMTLCNHRFVSLDLSECAVAVTMTSLKYLHQPRLEHLNLDWCWYFNEECLCNVLQNCPMLRELFATGCTDVTCESLRELNLSQLQVLNLGKCRTVDKSVICEITAANRDLYIVDYYEVVYKRGSQYSAYTNNVQESVDINCDWRWGCLSIVDPLRFFRGCDLL